MACGCCEFAGTRGAAWEDSPFVRLASPAFVSAPAYKVARFGRSLDDRITAADYSFQALFESDLRRMVQHAVAGASIRLRGSFGAGLGWRLLRSFHSGFDHI